MRTVGLACILLYLTVVPETAWGQYSYQNEPLDRIISDIHQQTSYRFLYRESLVSHIILSFKADSSDIFQQLQQVLATHRLAMNIDSTRRQVLIYRSNERSSNPEVRLSGYVVDAQTGERLPMATIFWNVDGGIDGTTASDAGSFQFRVPGDRETLSVTASYVGYESRTLQVDLTRSRGISDMTIRLEPTLLGGNEVIITGQSYYSALDTTLKSLVDIGRFSPLGESNSIRGLQMLPSVSVTPAMTSGVHVRGSSADGFQILLDGITIYNQSHLFGLLDSFNDNALKRSDFFYSVAPAQYQAPPGGTLALHTKEGSLNSVHGSVGVSNSSVQGTFEGPLSKDNSSWLLSGRHSYMNQVDWLNNRELVGWGLDIGRKREVGLDADLDPDDPLVTPGDHEARFYDLHGKLRFENGAGNRLLISGYLGGDLTDQTARRKINSVDFTNSDRLKTEQVDTRNEWGNISGSIRYQSTISGNLFSQTTAAISIYETKYAKEDFSYTQFQEREEGVVSLTFIRPFANRSILNDIKAEQQFDFTVSGFGISAGAEYRYFLGEYFEQSFDRPNFFSHFSSHKADLFTQLDYTGTHWFNLNLGSRVHYFSNGSFTEWSPRSQVTLFPDSRVSFEFGYSRNYQFLHQVNLDNVVSADVWILSNEKQPPVSVDNFTAGVYLKSGPALYLQVEGYLKYSENLRLHEINTQSLTNTFLEAPWFFDNDGYARGLELLMQNTFGIFSLTQTFTWSKTELRNEQILDGEWFPADWDRTYRYSASAAFNPVEPLSLYLSWIYASGTPNKLGIFGPDPLRRLGHYQRTDLSLEYSNRHKFGSINATVSFFNLLDRDNPWYREFSFVVDDSRSQPRLISTPVTVFDLGFQPSFELTVSF